MDKNTIGRYGWIVVVVIIIAILLGCAASFANGLRINFIGITNKLTGELDEAFDVIDESKKAPAYALLLDNSSNSATDTTPMIFVRSATPIKAGDTYNSATYGEVPVTEVYTGFETAVYNFDTTLWDSEIPWFDQRFNITSVVAENLVAPVSTERWFLEFKNCSKFDLELFDMYHVSNASYMFAFAGLDAPTFEILGLDVWDTSSIENMSHMFECLGASAPTWSLDLTARVIDFPDGSSYIAWDTSSVKDMSYMFTTAGRNATTFTLSGIGTWNTSNVTNMTYMLSEIGRSATTLELELGTKVVALSNGSSYVAWDTSLVTDMERMFAYTGTGSSTLALNGIGTWDTSLVTNMNSMFYCVGEAATTWSVGDLSQKSITLSNGESYIAWKTSSVLDMGYMFYRAGKNATSWSVGDITTWDTSSVTDMTHMFNSAGSKANYKLILTSWNVDNVTAYKNFNNGVTSKIGSPQWVN